MDPHIVYKWYRACQRYLKKNSTLTGATIVSQVAEEMRDPTLEMWYQADQTRIDKLTLAEYVKELATQTLPEDWQTKFRRTITTAKMKEGEPFSEWAHRNQNLCAILTTIAPTFAISNVALQSILDAGLSLSLLTEVDRDPPSSIVLHLWIVEVRTRDD